MSAGGAPAVALVGPTAAGKTDLAVALVERLPLEIVSVDSAMVYRGLDIGTGKPGPEVLARAPHRLIDIRAPHERYSAAEFRDDARREMAAIRAAGRVPFLVGGTGLYLRALRRGLAPLPPADAAVRARLEAEARERGWAALHERLRALDPRSAARIHPHDPQRIQRALEVFELTGRPMSALLDEGAAPGAGAATGRMVVIALEPGRRAWLHDRIAARFRAMLAAGLEDEVARLRADPRVHAGLASMRAVGYRQVLAGLEGRLPRADVERRAVEATRQLARRQLTWLRAETVDARVDCAEAGALRRVERAIAAALGA